MNEFDKPVVVVVPGDLHVTEPHPRKRRGGPLGCRPGKRTDSTRFRSVHRG